MITTTAAITIIKLRESLITDYSRAREEVFVTSI